MQKQITKYLNNLIDVFPDYEPTAEDTKKIEREGLESFILNKVISNKYRKTSITDDFKKQILLNIKTSLKENKPLRFTIPTGGYKKWQFKDIAPEVDWSELFHIRFMIDYLSPITSVYEKGVLLEYFSNAWLIKKISHYPQEDLDKYTNSFRSLIKVYEKMLPDNFKIKFQVVSDQKDEEELLKRISRNVPAVEQEFMKLSKTKMQDLLKYSERNIRWDILEKSNKLSKIAKDKIIREGKVIHDALLKGGWNSDLYYLFNDNAIPIIHRKSNSEFLHIATCRGSYVQFWVGRGILIFKNRELIPTALSFDQYQRVKDKLKKYKYNGLKLKNFNSIDVLGD